MCKYWWWCLFDITFWYSCIVTFILFWSSDFGNHVWFWYTFFLFTTVISLNTTSLSSCTHLVTTSMGLTTCFSSLCFPSHKCCTPLLALTDSACKSTHWYSSVVILESSCRQHTLHGFRTVLKLTAVVKLRSFKTEVHIAGMWPTFPHPALSLYDSIYIYICFGSKYYFSVMPCLTFVV